MNTLINQLNNAVGKSTEPITQSASAAVSASNKLAQTVGVGKMGISPIPVPFPNQRMPYGMTHFTVPLALEKESEPETMMWLPCDPLISINGGNSVVKKEIANGQIKGTVKEFWKNNDYEINISGILITDEVATVDEYIQSLRDLLEAKEALTVTCSMLNDNFNITRFVVESFDFPATDGTENQFFTISGVSDDSYNLQID